MSITRFSVLPDDRGLLLGVDKAGIFKPGIVYEVVSLLGEYIIRPIGVFGLPKNEGGIVNINSDANNILCTGLHLSTISEPNTILKTDERPTKIKNSINEIYELISDNKLDEAELKIDELSKIIMCGEPELTKAKIIIFRKRVIGK